MDKNEGIKKMSYDAERRESSKIMKDIHDNKAWLKNKAQDSYIYCTKK